MEAALAQLRQGPGDRGAPGPSTGNAAADILLAAAADHIRVESERLRHTRIGHETAEGAAGIAGELEAALIWEASSTLPFSQPPMGMAQPALQDGYPVRLGLGSPSTMGCLGIDGRTVRWSVFTDASTGIVTAMDQLGLSLLGLPGARLHSRVVLPRELALRFRLQATSSTTPSGGPSYASVAILWNKTALPQVSSYSGIGSTRRLWVTCPTTDGVLHIACVYLPPLPRFGGDDAWHEELEGLARDIGRIRGDLHGRQPRVFIMGDFNLQPSSLGGGPDRSPARDRHWNKFVQGNSLITLNPAVGSGPPQAVGLPLRGKDVMVLPGHTHHCAGQSRALDLMVATAGVARQAVVHNSLHCSATSPCRWPVCCEYTRGDHFLMETVLEGRSVANDMGVGALRMPTWWLSPDSWAAGLAAAAPALERLNGILQDCLDGGAPMRLRVREAQWLADALAWVLRLILHLVLVLWVVPAGGGPRQPPQRGARARGGATTASSSSRPGAFSGFPSQAEAGTAAGRALKAPEPKPPPCLRQAGQVLSPQASMAAWCRQVRQQSVWPGVHDCAFEAFVKRALPGLLGTARAHRGDGPFDMPITQAECVQVVSEWGDTAATTPDLVPRVVLQLRHSLLDSVIFRLMKLLGPGGLALRPRLWRGANAVTRYKEGPPDEGESYRLIMVRAQLGLLQEGLLFQRLQGPLRDRITQGQSGYIRDVGDAHLLLHELTAAAIQARKTIIAVFGDLQKAFPRTWREGLLLNLHEFGGVRDGAFALLRSILEEDCVHINHNGCAVVWVQQGVPEGGSMGPLAFPLYMEGLTRELLAADLGVGIGARVPEAWREHTWAGEGTPSPELTGRLEAAIREGGPLPSPALLA